MPNTLLSSIVHCFYHKSLGLLVVMVSVLMGLTGCVTNETQIAHYRHSTLNYQGEHIVQTTQDNWQVNRTQPVNASIRLSPNDSQVNLSMNAPTNPSHPYPIVYPHLLQGDCYTMKPVIVNGEQATIIQPCQ